MRSKMLVALLGPALFSMFLPMAKADNVVGCGPGSGSIDATCIGSISDVAGVWSGTIQGTITGAFALTPTDPPFVFNELGSAAINKNQFSFSFNTGSGTFSFGDVTNNAFQSSGTIAGFTLGADSITLDGLVVTQHTFDVSGCVLPAGLADCVLTAPPVGIPLLTTGSDPFGAVTIDYADSGVTSMTLTTPTPEPTTLLLLGTGLPGLAAFFRKRAVDAAL